MSHIQTRISFSPSATDFETIIRSRTSAGSDARKCSGSPGGCGPGAGRDTAQAGRVLLDGHRTAVEDPKSTASRRTVPVEQIRPGTVALLHSLKRRQAADPLAVGPGYPETGLVLVDQLGQPHHG